MNNNNSSNNYTITIKQESMEQVDSIVGSFVDSTTFLHSPNSQMVNPNLVQNNGVCNGVADGSGEFSFHNMTIIRFLSNFMFYISWVFVSFFFNYLICFVLSSTFWFTKL